MSKLRLAAISLAFLATSASAATLELVILAFGNGSGTVLFEGEGIPAGTRCRISNGQTESTCSLSLPAGTRVKVSAASGSGSLFGGWSGGSCAQAADCSLKLTASTSLKAQFRKDLSALKPLLTQWWYGLEATYGGHFLLQPTDASVSSPAELRNLLAQWYAALEAWRGSHTLLEPTLERTADEAAARTLLRQWEGSLENWQSNFLTTP